MRLMITNAVWQEAILERTAILDLLTSRPALAKLPLLFWHGSGIVFNFKIRIGRADSFIACQCGRWWNKPKPKFRSGCKTC